MIRLSFYAELFNSIYLRGVFMADCALLLPLSLKGDLRWYCLVVTIYFFTLLFLVALVALLATGCRFMKLGFGKTNCEGI
jgi:hypothetical protein